MYADYTLKIEKNIKIGVPRGDLKIFSFQYQKLQNS